ncbi:MAG: hypothetical protein OCC49_18060 [Fibrobacterales bacterium]
MHRAFRNRTIPLGVVICFIVLLSLFQGYSGQLDSQESEISEQYERIIKNEMLKYFKEGTFIVDVKVALKERLVPKKYKRLRTEDEIDKLPGLPVLPAELRAEVKSNNSDSVKVSDYDAIFEVKYADVTILVDSSYTLDEFGFIVDLVMMVANLEEMRGDRVNISQKKFPDELLRSGHLQENIDQDAFLPAIEEPLTERERIVNSVIKLLPIIIVSVLLFLFLVITLGMLLKYYRSKNEFENTEKLTQMIQQISDQSKEAIIGNEDDTMEGAGSEERVIEDLAYKTNRISILNSFIGRPEKSTEVLKGWIEKSAEEGFNKAALLVMIIDEKVLDVIRPFMVQATVAGIELELKVLEKPDEESALFVMAEFKEDYNKRIADDHEDKDNYDIFNFLKQLTNDQVLHVLKGEEEGIIGIALAQLTPKVAGEVLQSYDGEKRSKLLISMGNISNIPVSLYKEVAEQLSTKALEVSNMRSVAADGIESIIEVIANLSVDGQSQYIHSISEMDLELAQKIRRFYVTFEDLSSLPDDILSKVLQEVDRDALSVALLHTQEDFINHILQLFPERMQAMIQSGVETNSDATPETIDISRKEILQRVRKELKQLGGLPQ